MDDKIANALQDRYVDGQLACADAHTAALELAVSPLDVGKYVNRATEVRFYRCQLGLFGFGLKAEGKHIIALPATNLPDDVVEAIQAQVVNGRISCASVWEIADQFAYPRLGIANVLEALKLKVKPCQLGCF